MEDDKKGVNEMKLPNQGELVVWGGAISNARAGDVGLQEVDPQEARHDLRGLCAEGPAGASFVRPLDEQKPSRQQL